MIITRTPLRISFLGGGTDYPAYFRRNAGLTLATSINRYTYVTVSPLTQFFDHSIGVHYSKVERVTHLDEIQHPSVRECLRYMGIESGLEIHIATDLPARTGLGSSSSFTVGLLNALYAYRGETVTSECLARDAVYVEQELIKERVGSQDQYACALGGVRALEFKKDDTVITACTVIDDERLGQLERRLTLFYTRIQRHAHEILDEQIDKTRVGKLDASLAAMKNLAAEGIEILNDPSRSLDEFGELLGQSWKIKARLSSKITSERIDQWYDSAIQAGAVGGKLLGAGGGGFLLLYVPEDRQQRVHDALHPLQEVPFAFEQSGSERIFQTN